jgi:hypothetical protein
LTTFSADSRRPFKTTRIIPFDEVAIISCEYSFILSGLVERIKNICNRVEEKINEMYEDMGERLEMLSPEDPTLNSLGTTEEAAGGLVDMA